MSRLIRAVFILALNAVPLAGVLFFDWSPGTLLAVIWVEVLLVGVANIVRIRLHREWTRTRGHYRLHFNERNSTAPEKSNRAESSGTLLAEYTTLTLVFTLAHGFFLGVILFALAQNYRGDGPSPWLIDLTALARGILAVLALTAAELLLDLASLRARPFSWLKERVQVSMAQVVIMHLAIIFGMFLVMYFETPLVFIGIIFGLKALLEIGMSGKKTDFPEKPPGWVAAIGRRQGIDIESEWTRIIAEEKQKLIDDELPLEG